MNRGKVKIHSGFSTIRFTLINVLFIFYPVFYALCAGVQFEVTVNSDTVRLGSSLQLNLSFYGAQNIPAPDIGSINGFTVRYLGPSTRVSIVNGSVSMSVTHIYSLLPLKTGTFKIGPFSVNYKGKTITSNSVTVNVVSSGSSPPPSEGREHAQALNEKELSDRIFVTMDIPKTKVYLNESIPLTIKLYVNRIAVRDIQYPQFKHDGFSAANFGKPRQYRETLSGVPYDVIEFNTRIFAVKPGRLILGPAIIKCNLLVQRKHSHKAGSLFDDFFGNDFDNGVFDDFFGDYELYPFNAVSHNLAVNVLPLPEEGKPDSFKGAVGDFRMDVKVSPKSVNVGDPVTLTMAVKGDGNFDTVICPQLNAENGFKVYQPHKKSSAGAKVFEQILMPESKNIKSIPEVIFSFFNPRDGRYHTIKKGPFPITVKASKEASVRVFEPYVKNSKLTSGTEKLGKDIVYIKEDPGCLKKKGVYIYKEWGYWFIQIAVLLIFLSWMSFYKYNERIKNDVEYARRLAAPKKARAGIRTAQKMLENNDTVNFFNVVFGTLREYFADKFHLSLGSIAQGSLDGVLKSKGIDEDMRRRIKSIFDDCDAARFASSEFGREKMEDVFKNMREVIDYMEKRKI